MDVETLRHCTLNITPVRSFSREVHGPDWKKKRSQMETVSQQVTPASLPLLTQWSCSDLRKLENVIVSFQCPKWLVSKIHIIAEKNQINTSDNKNCAEMLALAYIQKCTYTRLLLVLKSEDHGKLETSCFIHFFASHLHHKSIFLCYKTGMICTGDLCMTSARNWNNSKAVCLLYLLTLKNNNFNIVFGSKTC